MGVSAAIFRAGPEEESMSRGAAADIFVASRPEAASNSLKEREKKKMCECESRGKNVHWPHCRGKKTNKHIVFNSRGKIIAQGGCD